MESGLALRRSPSHLALLSAASVGAALAISTLNAAIATWLWLPWMLATLLAYANWQTAPRRLRMTASGLGLAGEGGEWQEIVGVARELPFLLQLRVAESRQLLHLWRDSMAESDWRQVRYWLATRLVLTAANDHVLAGEIDRHHDGVLGNR